MEPNGGNVYKAHMLLVDSGTFWRCTHDKTGFDSNMNFVGCPECASDDPLAYELFHNEHSQQIPMLFDGKSDC